LPEILITRLDPQYADNIISVDTMQCPSLVYWVLTARAWMASEEQGKLGTPK
jgi:hypothetical protein